MKHLNTALFILTSIFFCISCTKTPAKVCDPKDEFTAGFQVGQGFYNGRFVPSDTLVAFTAHFQADTIYDSYHWTVGNDARTFNTKSFSLQFGMEEYGKSVEVQLIATGPKNPCNPLDNGIDTIKKSFYVTYPEELDEFDKFDDRYDVNLPFFGKWHGYFKDNPKDTFTVLINNNGFYPRSGYQFDTYFGFRIYNLPKGCLYYRFPLGTGSCPTTITDSIIYYSGYSIAQSSYNAFWVDKRYYKGICCGPVEMFGIMDTKENTISIECSFYERDGQMLATPDKRVFVGRKL